MNPSVSSRAFFSPLDTSNKCSPSSLLPLMRVVSPFSLSIPWWSQHESCSNPKFTLEIDPDSDPSSSPASVSPSHVTDLDYALIPSSISDSAMTTPRPPRRRWTLAMAMTDEGLTDEALVQVLERIRLQPESSETSSADKSTAVWDVDHDTWNWNLQWEGNVDEADSLRNGPTTVLRPGEIPFSSPPPTSFPPPLHHSLSVPSSPNRAATTPWQTARQALLACRELVRTERHYLASLNNLIASETATVPPPLMIHYASQLASVSKHYLACMEADPSALSVSAAFLGLEEAIEGAFVGWCGVVGAWFEGSGSTSGNSSVKASSGASSPIRRVSKGRSEGDIPVLGTRTGSLRRTLSRRKDVPIMTSLNTSTSPPSPCANGPTSPIPLYKSTSSSFLNWRRDRDRLVVPNHHHHHHHHQPNGNNIKKPPVRDLAILPTQRILRYVLLYRDLLAHTPATSPSRALVEGAVEAATRIAQKCDRAQDNAAFLIKPQPKSTRQRANSKIFLARSRKTSADDIKISM